MDFQTKKIELIQLVLDSENEFLLKEIHELLHANAEKEELTNAQKAELDKRLQRLHDGKTEFYTFEEYENRLNEPE